MSNAHSADYKVTQELVYWSTFSIVVLHCTTSYNPLRREAQMNFTCIMAFKLYQLYKRFLFLPLRSTFLVCTHFLQRIVLTTNKKVRWNSCGGERDEIRFYTPEVSMWSARKQTTPARTSINLILQKIPMTPQAAHNRAIFSLTVVK